jgi:hypothetical protein
LSNRDNSKKHEAEAKKQSESSDISDFVFSCESRLNLKKSASNEKERQAKNDKSNPLYVSSAPDHWGRLIAALTLIVLIAYTIYTRNQWITLDNNVIQTKVLQASQITITEATVSGPHGVRFVFTNVGNTDAKNIGITFKISQFPDARTMMHFCYDPIIELDAFRKATAYEHCPDKVSADDFHKIIIGNAQRGIPIQYIARSRSSEWSFDSTLIPPPPERKEPFLPLDVILILLDWDDPFGHEQNEFCEFALPNVIRPCFGVILQRNQKNIPKH